MLLEIFNTKYYFLHIILVYEKFCTSRHFKSKVNQSFCFRYPVTCALLEMDQMVYQPNKTPFTDIR